MIQGFLRYGVSLISDWKIIYLPNAAAAGIKIFYVKEGQERLRRDKEVGVFYPAASVNIIL